MLSNPGIKSWYPSDLCSPWHVWFHELGYPDLDINQHKDGSWEIIQYHCTPNIPSLTPFHMVLGMMRNVLITEGFITNYVNALDLKKREKWAVEEAKTKRMEAEKVAQDLHRRDMVERASKSITRNPALMDRIAKKGMSEIDPLKIARHIPYYRW